jgi:ABC-type dipeptide/oligopeptide/nickel transport system ATPase component
MAVLDGEMTVEEHLLEAGRLGHKSANSASVWLERLGLAERLLTVPADVLSSSEAARIDLARSLAVSPRAILFDEPRDAAIGADGGLLTSLISGERAKGTSFLLATSEPDLARQIGDRIAILDSGLLIEMGPREAVLKRPAHPRTLDILAGNPCPQVMQKTVPKGCPFTPDCPRRIPKCELELPHLIPVAGAQHHRAMCFNQAGTSPAPEAPVPDLSSFERRADET